eukprot:490424-Rhodomonas_salina.1
MLGPQALSYIAQSAKEQVADAGGAQVQAPYPPTSLLRPLRYYSVCSYARPIPPTRLLWPVRY